VRHRARLCPGKTIEQATADQRQDHDTA
jgi:hypothetical protein